MTKNAEERKGVIGQEKENAHKSKDEGRFIPVLDATSILWI